MKGMSSSPSRAARLITVTARKPYPQTAREERDSQTNAMIITFSIRRNVCDPGSAPRREKKAWPCLGIKARQPGRRSAPEAVRLHEQRHREAFIRPRGSKLELDRPAPCLVSGRVLVY